MNTSDRASLQRIARQAMQERGLDPDFPAAVQAEVARLASAGPPAGGRDLRGLLWASIDNDDSRDLDQLSVAEALPTGETKVLVAIADVDALVAADSAIDLHASQNTTSVYTAAETFSMLPERLSTDLTSLVENADREALVVELIVAADGAVSRSDIYAATVRNRAKLAYGGVGSWLEGGRLPPPIGAVTGLEANLRRQDAVAESLGRLRHAHGALSLERNEARPSFSGDTLRDFSVEPQNRAARLIENFMIAANSATAGFLDAKKMPSLRRIVKTPERWDRIVALARQSGDQLPAQPDGVALESWLVRSRAAHPDRFEDLSLSVVKLLGRGEYVAQQPGESSAGHFGLAVHDYTHATAPNRRFADLVTQRLLKAALAGRPAPYGDRLNEIARRCTEREDAANRVERQVRKAAWALLLAPRVGEVFDAIVTGASEKGTWVRLRVPPVEGKLERGAQGLDVGEAIRARLIDTNAERGFIDFARA